MEHHLLEVASDPHWPHNFVGSCEKVSATTAVVDTSRTSEEHHRPGETQSHGSLRCQKKVKAKERGRALLTEHSERPLTFTEQYCTVFPTTKSIAKKERDLQILWNLRSVSISLFFDSNLRYSSERKVT
jgi:hypothetical protein